jgi:hypothetical protein
MITMLVMVQISLDLVEVRRACLRALWLAERGRNEDGERFLAGTSGMINTGGLIGPGPSGQCAIDGGGVCGRSLSLEEKAVVDAVVGIVPD